MIWEIWEFVFYCRNLNLMFVVMSFIGVYSYNLLGFHKLEEQK